jgi:nitrogen fixation protein FixH
MILQPRDLQPRGWWIPWTFVALFLVVAAVNGAMIWLAVGSFPGLVTDKAYDRGLAYNRNLEAAAAQAALGWKLRIDSRWLGPTQLEIEAVLTDAGGVPVDGARVRGELSRPAEAGGEFLVELQGLGQGVYRAATPVTRFGVWDLHLVVERDGALFVADERLGLR